MFNFFETLESRSLLSTTVPASVNPAITGSALAAVVHVAPHAAKAPTAKLSAKPITSALSLYKFTVTYKSSAKLTAASIKTGNIKVTGPNGYTYTARLVSITPKGNATSIVATYSITPTSGSTFSSTSDGTYTITLAAKSVKDIKKGTNAKAVKLGTFTANIGTSTGTLPNLVGNYTGTTIVPNVSPLRNVAFTVTSENSSGNFSGNWVTDAGVLFTFTGKVAANGHFTYSFSSDASHATGPVTGSGTGTGGGTSALAFSYVANSGGFSAPGTMNVTKA